MDELLPLRDADFRWVAAMLYERFGIKLGDQKRVLVAGRLTKRVRQLGLASFADYFTYLHDKHFSVDCQWNVGRQHRRFSGSLEQ